MTPYEAVYDIKSHRGCEHHDEQPRKRQKITENQEKYNNEMITQSQKIYLFYIYFFYISLRDRFNGLP